MHWCLGQEHRNITSGFSLDEGPATHYGGFAWPYLLLMLLFEKERVGVKGVKPICLLRKSLRGSHVPPLAIAPKSGSFSDSVLVIPLPGYTAVPGYLGSDQEEHLDTET